MPHSHNFSDALPYSAWRSYGYLQCFRLRPLRVFFDQVISLLEMTTGSMRESYGLRFCQENHPNFPECNIDRNSVPWERLYPIESDFITSANEFRINAADIETHPAFDRGVLSFQVDFVEGFMCQFDVSYSEPSMGSTIRLRESLDRLCFPDKPKRWLEVRAVTDLPMRLRDITTESLPKVCAFYDFWKNASSILEADLCFGGPYHDYDGVTEQPLEFAAFQFGKGLPRWGTKPFEERRMPWKVELERTRRAQVWFDKLENSPLAPKRSSPYGGYLGTMWWEPWERGGEEHYAKQVAPEPEIPF